MDKDVVEKCLAFCQALSSSNQLFSFNLKIGSDSFTFDMKELVKSSGAKKKKSPSQLRREKKRRDERKRAASKAEEDIAKVSDKSAKPKCDPCGTSFNSEEDLNAHRESDHKALPTPEKEHSIASCSELQLSPIHMQRNEEKLSEQGGASSPASPPRALSVVCDQPMKPGGGAKCGKTFTKENDLRMHSMKNHNYCLEHKRAVAVNRRCWMCAL